MNLSTAREACIEEAVAQITNFISCEEGHRLIAVEEANRENREATGKANDDEGPSL